MIEWVVVTPRGSEWVEAASYAVHDNGVLAFYTDGNYFAKPTYMIGPLVKMFAPGRWLTMYPKVPLPITRA